MPERPLRKLHCKTRHLWALSPAEQLFASLRDLLDRLLCFFKGNPCRDADNDDPTIRKMTVSLCIFGLLELVRRSIDLDIKSQGWTVETKDISTKRELPAEPKAGLSLREP